MSAEMLIIASKKNYFHGMVEVESTLQLLNYYLNEVRGRGCKCGQLFQMHSNRSILACYERTDLSGGLLFFGSLKISMMGLLACYR